MKINYNIVALEVEKLYQKQLINASNVSDMTSKEVSDINSHCDFIVAFIEACGWTSDDYIRRMYKDELKFN
jgi:hypothetical protein